MQRGGKSIMTGSILALATLTFGALASEKVATASPGDTIVTVDEKLPMLLAEPDQAHESGDSVLAAGDPIAKTIFLNRCVGNCTITKTTGRSDARTNMSSIPMGTGTFLLTEWQHGDAAWDELMACVRDVFAPYDVEITDVDPGASVLHHESIVAGLGSQIGWGSAGGVGQVACEPINNGISFVFANQTPDVEYLCYAVAQEAAHTFSLDHAFECSDPLTYLSGCGRKYFRNLDAQCGEFQARQCSCGNPTQNSHRTLINTFGASNVQLPTPTVEILSPNENEAVIAGFSVFAEAQANRGVSDVEVWINGYRWSSVTDDDFSTGGGTYTLRVPTTVPDGRLDIEVRAYNDLKTNYGSTTRTVQQGALCTNAATDCAEGQQCDGEGRCFWQPASSEIGDVCDYPQACLSGLCEVSPDGEKVCTSDCFSGTANACGDGLTCVSNSGGSGFCFAGGDGDDSGGGCCSATTTSSGRTAGQLLLAGLAVTLLVRPRRRRRA